MRHHVVPILAGAIAASGASTIVGQNSAPVGFHGCSETKVNPNDTTTVCEWTCPDALECCAATWQYDADGNATGATGTCCGSTWPGA